MNSTISTPAETSAHASSFSYSREITLTRITIGLTFIAWAMASWEMLSILFERFNTGSLATTAEQLAFIVIVNLLIYGNFVYQFTRLGYFKRKLVHRPATPEALEQSAYAGQAHNLTILVPSYKEEFDVVRSTLLSAALQDYPNRRVVLLIDDPHHPKNPVDRAALHAIRQLPLLLQGVFDLAAIRFRGALRDYQGRSSSGNIHLMLESYKVAQLYKEAAHWFERHAAEFSRKDHADDLLMHQVFANWRKRHLQRAQELEKCAVRGEISEARLLREYRRLAALFQVEMSSFERKRYVNLSHEPNKAMNLNSYIELIGKSWREEQRADGLHLVPANAAQATLSIPEAEFLITLDADSLLLPDYALRLIHHMQQPGNERVAVAQTPYSAIPGAAGALERIAGATTDIQYMIHQGFTQHNATFWVGANALLRKTALLDIRSVGTERGFPIAKYIQDRTVIEDTESSVDLVERGWSLFNYPERLAYSATPPDFGSLLIQRRRWANGGLLILPKLVRYLLRAPLSTARMAEGFFRCHYLGSIAVVNIGLLIVLALPFERSIESAMLPLTALPYFFLYARDLAYAGYKQRDLLGVYALNLLLIPINLGGVFKSIEQAITGKQIPFGRTPKVLGRTAAPALYILAEYGLLVIWLTGTLFDAYHGRWTHALFSLSNAVLLGYGIKRFIGLNESKEDLQAAWSRKPKLLLPSVQQPIYALAGAQPQSQLWLPASVLQDEEEQNYWLEDIFSADRDVASNASRPAKPGHSKV